MERREEEEEEFGDEMGQKDEMRGETRNRKGKTVCCFSKKKIRKKVRKTEAGIQETRENMIKHNVEREKSEREWGHHCCWIRSFLMISSFRASMLPPEVLIACLMIASRSSFRKVTAACPPLPLPLLW
jgi:hypothetical protein